MFSFFKHDQLKRYTIAFGSFFNNLQVVRDTADGTILQQLVVPLEYGPKERWLVRLTQDPNLDQAVGIILPRMTYELTSVAYDSSRKVNSLNQLSYGTAGSNTLNRIWAGVPYNLTYELSIMVKYQQDGFQIVEQILPYFTPEMTYALRTVPALGLVDTVPLILNSVTHTDNYEGDFEKRRAIVWTLTFTMRGYLYGPTRAQGRVQEVVVDIYNTIYDNLLDPPEVLAAENGENVVNEDESGFLVSEATANIYSSVGRVSRIDTTGVDTENPVTTITEWDGDVKRTRLFPDEEL